MTTIRAVVFDRPGGEDVLRIDEVPRPSVGPRDVRIRVRTTSVNRADLLQRQGLYPPPPGVTPVLGLDCAGEVLEVGSEVRRWKPGDRVMALLPGGGYAEEAVVDEGSVLAVPEGMTDEEAGAFPEVFLTAFLNIFLLGGASRGGVVLVHGGGSGVGTAAIGLCREAGVRVIVTAGTDEKCRRAIEHGAEAAVNYRTGDFVSVARERTGGRGVDVVLDCVGAAYLSKNLDALGEGGRLVVIGLIGGAKAELSLAALLVRRLSVIGSTLRGRSNEEKAAIVEAFEKRFGEALRAGRLRPVLDRVLPLERVAEAHRAMQAGEHFGKIVLRVAPRP
ncbi:MAG: NAD(P)H quinone oxidoreductase [Candidatus Binatia bacterium]|nr:MAG: NAD(P)H quinone oxidoreductase [Candidatus Binatia bacterium]